MTGGAMELSTDAIAAEYVNIARSHRARRQEFGEIMIDQDAANRIDWVAVREDYVTGAATMGDLAERLGIPLRTIEERASSRSSHGSTWGQQRADFRAQCASEFRETARSRQVKELLRRAEATDRVRIEMETNVGTLVSTIVPLAIRALETGEVRGADAVRLALSALELQRRVHGLDRLGPFGTALEARRTVTVVEEATIPHGPLDPELAERAKRLLEGVFGATNDP